MKRPIHRKKSNAPIVPEVLDPRILLADVTGVALDRVQIFSQSDATTVTASPFATYIAGASVMESAVSSVNSASLISPAAPSSPYEMTEEPDNPDFSPDLPPYTTKAAFDADFPEAGTYQIKFDTVHDGNKTFNLNFNGTTYPSNAPQLTNFDALQKIDATKAFTMTWPAFAGGTANDLILVSITDEEGNNVFTSSKFLEPGHLTGTATQVTIPANTLQPGFEYAAAIGFGKIAQTDTSTYPGVTAAAFWAKSTSFLLHTTGGTGKINGNVYNDTNSNGFKDPTENSLPGIVVFLDMNNNNTLDAVETRTTTDAAGHYAFTNLYAGMHHVRQVLPAGYRKSQPTGQPGYNEFLATAEEISNEDFGDTKNILLAGKVFNDANSNGVRDASESFLSGVVINIKSNNAIVATRTTDAIGSWQVKGLSAGTGEADVVIPAGKTPTSPAGGKYTGSMTSGQQNANLNFGLKSTALATPVSVVTLSILSSDYDDLELFATPA